MAGAARRSWLLVLIAGVAMVAAAADLPSPIKAVVVIVTQFVMVSVTIYALSKQEAPQRSGWWVLLGTSALGLAATGLLLVPEAGLPDSAWPVAQMTRFAVFVVGLVLLLGVRNARPADQNFLDAGIVAAGLTIVAWTFLVMPQFGDRPPHGEHAGIAISLAVLNVCLLSIVVRVVSAPSLRSPSMLLVATAAGTVFITNVVAIGRMGADGLAGFQSGGAANIGWQLCTVLIAAAALHPSYGMGYRAPSAAGRHELPWIRFVTFGAVALAAPVVPVIGLVNSGDLLPPYSLPAVAGSAALTCVLLVLLVIRLGNFARLSVRRANALNDQSAAMLAQANTLRRALDDQQALQQELTHRANHDPLTGLANRILLADRLLGVLRARPVSPGGLLLIDLDGFKNVNDTVGHPAGDELLMHVSERLRHASDEADCVARLGGDEFALLLADREPEHCRAVAQRVVDTLHGVSHRGQRQHNLTVSGGLLLFGLEPHEPADVLRDADLALYAAKQQGGDRYVEFHPRMRRAHRRHADLAAGVRAALADDSLTVVYQPIVELGTGTPVATEALLRWRTPSGTRVPAGEFIAVAEDIGLIAQVGARVLRDAAVQGSRWHARHGVSLSVNVSGRQLTSPTFAADALNLLADGGLPPEALIAEITETVLVDATGASGAEAMKSLEELRRHGVRIAVDDFGTGYSSLAYLQRLPIDILKIDRMFTSTLRSEGTRESRFVGAILGLGSSLGLPTVAEGVQTARQAGLLTELGCGLAQGHHFARPRSAAQTEEYLAGVTRGPERETAASAQKS